MLAEIFAYLPGYVVFHKMAVASKQFRKASRILGPMNQDRVIWLNQAKFENQHLNYKLVELPLESIIHTTNRIGIDSKAADAYSTETRRVLDQLWVMITLRSSVP